jgi:SPP1 family phage portal protein
MTAEKKYGLGALELKEEKRPYKETVQTSEADGEEIIVGENYPSLPIAVMYGNRNHQSTLIGMKANIDAFDLISSGYANDLSECAQVYWLIDNAAGMQDEDIARLRDRMLLQHIVVADEQNSQIKPFSAEIPFNSREACLNRIKDSIYRDFGALDVMTLIGGQRTATEIRAAYQPMDLEADDFEYQVNEFVQQILSLIGIEDYPVFDRNRISNEKEETEMIMLATNYLDDRTVLEKLPFVTVDEVDNILARKGEADLNTVERIPE